MNVLFHIAAAAAISVSLTNPKAIDHGRPITKIKLMIILFCSGILSHGILDMIPHCYPINSKLDFLLSSLLICSILFLLNKKYRLLLAFGFLGALFPDIVDLSIPILNKYANLNLPVHENYFPWHWKNYSGSIYNADCTNSVRYQAILLLGVTFICYLKRRRISILVKKDPG